MDKGQPERALAAFRRARERDPSFLDPAVMIARLSLIEGDVEEAESVLRSADPALLNRDDLRFLLGYLMLVKGSEEKAEKAFLNLQRRSPESGWGLWGLGLVALSLDDAGGALEKMEAASALTPRLPEAEARVRTYLVGIWMRGDSAPREEGFLALFPSLTDLRDRYRKLFNQTG
jgi:tetratricopeptide (TPR) repeat protein